MGDAGDGRPAVRCQCPEPHTDSGYRGGLCADEVAVVHRCPPGQHLPSVWRFLGGPPGRAGECLFWGTNVPGPLQTIRRVRQGHTPFVIQGVPFRFFLIESGTTGGENGCLKGKSCIVLANVQGSRTAGALESRGLTRRPVSSASARLRHRPRPSGHLGLPARNRVCSGAPLPWLQHCWLPQE